MIRTILVGLLAALALVGFVAEGAAAPHSHEAAEVALYNEDCSLALLARLTPSALLLQMLSAAPLVLLVLIVVPLVVRDRLGAALRIADVRAPPAS